MKWIFILLLLCNILYFGWELDRQTKITINNSSTAIAIPGGTEKLKLLSELGEGDTLAVKIAKPEVPQPDVSSPEGKSVQEGDAGQAEAQMMAARDSDASETGSGSKSELLKSLPELNVSNLTKGLDQGEELCFTYGPLPDGDESDRLADWFRTRHLWVNQRQTDEKGRQLFWVYLTPRNTKANAVAAFMDLKNKGVSDLFLIKKGGLVNAISLGLFSTQVAVNKRLSEITGKGYKPVVVPHYGGKKIHWLDIRINQKKHVLNEVFESLPARYNSVPVKCNEIALATVNP
ncbi:MAG: hypothetical protein V3R68_04550 [Gammaproteobacteria bacterium]